MQLYVSTNAIEIAKLLGKDVTEQIPFATAQALNRIADRINDGERKVMARVLDRPTPYTMNSFFVTKATKTKQQSKAGLRDWSPKGTAASKYMAPQVFGGPRSHTKFEGAMRRRGLIPGNAFLVPAPGAELDSYGNVKRGTITRIMSAFGAHRETGYQANRTGSKRSQRKAKASQYWIGEDGDGTFAIWQRLGKGGAFKDAIKPIYWISNRQPRYRKRLAFFEIAENIHKANYGKEFEIQLLEAIRTAK